MLPISLVKLFAETCSMDSSFFGFPHWYQYLDGETDALGKCVPTFDLGSINSLWGVALALADILLYVAGIVAVGYVIYGGFLYMTSSGEPERTRNAKNTIMNAIIGLVIAIISSVLVAFIGSSLK